LNPAPVLRVFPLKPEERDELLMLEGRECERLLLVIAAACWIAPNRLKTNAKVQSWPD
jgi:hypothetical protein